MANAHSREELQVIYKRRFADTAAYRNKVWQVLTSKFFNRWIEKEDTVLDLGCGYGEFINNIEAGKKYGMDLNPESKSKLNSDVVFFEQDCSTQWPLTDESLDAVLTSNFFEHLPGKTALSATLKEAHRCIKKGGRLIAMGPNIKYSPGRYWDFFDHHTILTEMSLAEAMEIEGFTMKYVVGRFLPYTLINAPQYPLFLLKLYLKMPWLWWIKGRQFLVVAKKK